MTEKLKIEFTNENGDRISWVSESEEPFGFLTDDYWRVCTEFYEVLGYKNPVTIEVDYIMGKKCQIFFDPKSGVYQ